jgi:hypothetical protein
LLAGDRAAREPTIPAIHISLFAKNAEAAPYGSKLKLREKISSWLCSLWSEIDGISAGKSNARQAFHGRQNA